MKTKDKLSNLLYQNRNTFLSGEEIATLLEISRTAVWKAIKSLKSDGYIIEAVTNKGYKFLGGESLNENFINSHLDKFTVTKIEILEKTTSTNTQLKSKVTGSDDGYLLVSKEQTAGKGRLGRSFYSPKGGLYFSLMLKPNLTISEAPFLTTLMAVAVCEAITNVTGKHAQIKWVNDIFCDGKKVCGILSEASFNLENNSLNYVIVGVGINIYAPKNGFPKHIADIATNLCKSGEARPNLLLAEIINRFYYYYNDFSKKEFVKKYKSLCFVVNKQITVIKGTETKLATAIALNDNLQLVVEYADALRETLSGGEISIKIN